MRNDICYNSKQVLQDDIENIFIDLLLPKTKPITVGIVYKPPHQTGFIEKITANFNSLKVADTEMYVLGDLNINLLQNSKYILENKKYHKKLSQYYRRCKKIHRVLSNLWS